jgi:Zn ribbon nucleic-acid-binding protein
MELHSPDVRKIPQSHCLQCGYKVDASASTDGSKALPAPGDIVVCMKCGAVMKHADDMSLRGMSDQEMDELTADTEFMDEIARAVQKVHFVRHAQG